MDLDDSVSGLVAAARMRETSGHGETILVRI